MRLALIRRRFSATGGAELYLGRLMRGLLDAGHEVHLYAESWQQPPHGARLHAVPLRASRAAAPRAFAEAVAVALQSAQFDCVFSLERTLGQDVHRAGDGVHAVWLERRRQFAPAWKRPFLGRGAFHRGLLDLESKTFNPAHTGRIIANSDMVRREIIERFTFPENRIHVVRNGIEVERFRHGDRAAARRRFGLGERDFVLLFAGSGWERKGLRFILEAVARLPMGACSLLVAGKGRRPAFAPPCAIYAGPIEDIETAFAAANLFVFTPIYEPSANVCFEALASGLPVVTSAQNGAAEIIEPSVTGTILPDPSDSAAIGAAIQWWRTRLTAGSTRIEGPHDLSIERNVRETIAILELAARDKNASL